jgi:hypothetical protein
MTAGWQHTAPAARRAAPHNNTCAPAGHAAQDVSKIRAGRADVKMASTHFCMEAIDQPALDALFFNDAAHAQSAAAAR